MEFDYQRTFLSISLVCWSCCWWLYLDILYAAVFSPYHRLFLFSLSTFPPLLLTLACITGHLTHPLHLTSIDIDDDDDHRSFLSRFIARYRAQFRPPHLRETVVVDLPVLALLFLVSQFFVASPAIYNNVDCTTSSAFVLAVVYVGGCGFYLVSLQDADWFRYWNLVYVLGVLAYNIPFIGDYSENPQREKHMLVVILSVVIVLLCNIVHCFRGKQELLARYL